MLGSAVGPVSVGFHGFGLGLSELGLPEFMLHFHCNRTAADHFQLEEYGDVRGRSALRFDAMVPGFQQGSYIWARFQCSLECCCSAELA